MIKKIIIVSMPFILFACSALKPVEKLSDKELVDKYYKTDLKLYMAKRAGSGYSTSPSPPKEYVGKGNNKISKIEKQLEVMRQELIRRGYIP
ncbi:MAG: hypothetical protein ACE5GU_02820 [Candidatus Scalinduaceae bacterium]